MRTRPQRPHARTPAHAQLALLSVLPPGRLNPHVHAPAHAHPQLRQGTPRRPDGPNRSAALPKSPFGRRARGFFFFFAVSSLLCFLLYPLFFENIRRPPLASKFVGRPLRTPLAAPRLPASLPSAPPVPRPPPAPLSSSPCRTRSRSSRRRSSSTAPAARSRSTSSRRTLLCRRSCCCSCSRSCCRTPSSYQCPPCMDWAAAAAACPPHTMATGKKGSLSPPLLYRPASFH